MLFILRPFFDPPQVRMMLKMSCNGNRYLYNVFSNQNAHGQDFWWTSGHFFLVCDKNAPDSLLEMHKKHPKDTGVGTSWYVLRLAHYSGVLSRENQRYLRLWFLRISHFLKNIKNHKKWWFFEGTQSEVFGSQTNVSNAPVMHKSYTQMLLIAVVYLVVQ